jgi:hypothetical protein
MPLVRMMQVPMDEIVDVIAVRHCLVAATWSVDVSCFMRATVVARCAFRRIILVY